MKKELGCRVIGFVDVNTTLPSQARLSGKIHRGDVVAAIDGTSVLSKPYEDIIGMLQAPSSKPNGRELTFRSVKHISRKSRSSPSSQSSGLRSSEKQYTSAESSCSQSQALSETKSMFTQEMSNRMLKENASTSFNLMTPTTQTHSDNCCKSSVSQLPPSNILQSQMVDKDNATLPLSNNSIFSPSNVRKYTGNSLDQTSIQNDIPSELSFQKPIDEIFKIVTKNVVPLAGVAISQTVSATTVLKEKVMEALNGYNKEEFEHAMLLKRQLLTELSLARAALEQEENGKKMLQNAVTELEQEKLLIETRKNIFEAELDVAEKAKDYAEKKLIREQDEKAKIIHESSQRAEETIAQATQLAAQNSFLRSQTDLLKKQFQSKEWMMNERMLKMQRDIDKKTKNFKLMQSEMDKMKSLLKLKDEKIKESTEDVVKKATDLTSAQQKLDEKVLEMQVMSKRFEAIHDQSQEKLHDLETHIEELTHNANEAKIRESEFVQILESKSNMIKSIQSTSHNLELELQSTKSELKEVENKLSSSLENIEELESKLNDALGKNIDLEGINYSLKISHTSEIELLKEKNLTKEKEIQRSIEESDLKVKKQRELEEALKRKGDELKSMSEEWSEKEQKLSNKLDNLMQAEIDQKKKICKEKSAFEERISFLENELDQLRGLNIELNKEKAKTMLDMNTMKENFSEKEKQTVIDIESLKEHANCRETELKGHINQVFKENENLKSRISHLTKEQNEQKDELNSLKGSISLSENSCREAEEAALRESKLKLSFQSQLNNEQKEKAKLLDDMDVLQKKFAEATIKHKKSLEEVNSQLNDSKNLIQSTNVELEDMKGQHESFIVELKNVHLSEIKELNSSCENKDRHLHQKSVEIESLIKKRNRDVDKEKNANRDLQVKILESEELLCQKDVELDKVIKGNANLVEQLNNRIDVYSKSNQEMQCKLLESGKIIEQKSTKIEVLMKSNVQAVKNLNANIDAKENVIRELNEKIAKQEGELMEKTMKLGELAKIHDNHVQELNDEIEKNKKFNIALEARLKESEEILENKAIELDNVIRSSANEVDKFNTEIALRDELLKDKSTEFDQVIKHNARVVEDLNARIECIENVNNDLQSELEVRDSKLFELNENLDFTILECEQKLAYYEKKYEEDLKLLKFELEEVYNWCGERNESLQLVIKEKSESIEHGENRLKEVELQCENTVSDCAKLKEELSLAHSDNKRLQIENKDFIASNQTRINELVDQVNKFEEIINCQNSAIRQENKDIKAQNNKLESLLSNREKELNELRKDVLDQTDQAQKIVDAIKFDNEKILADSKRKVEMYEVRLGQFSMELEKKKREYEDNLKCTAKEKIDLLETLKKQVKEKDDAILSLKTEINMIQKQFKEASASYEDMKRRYEEISLEKQTEIKSIEDKFKCLLPEIEKKDAEIGLLSEKLEIMASQNLDVESRARKAVEMVESREQVIDTLKRSIQALIEETIWIQENIQKNSSLEDKSIDCDDSIIQRKNEWGDINELRKNVRFIIDQAANECDQRMTIINKLESSLEETHQNSGQLQRQIQEYELQIQGFVNKTQQYKEEMETLRKEGELKKVILMESVSDEASRAEALAQELSAKSKEFESLQIDLSDVVREKQQLTKKIEKLESMLSFSEVETFSLAVSIEENKNVISKLNRILDEKNQEINKASLTRNRVNQLLEESKSEMLNKMEEIEKLRNSVSENESETALQTVEIQQLKSKNEKQKKTNEYLKLECDQKNEKLRKQESQLQDLGKNYESLLQKLKVSEASALAAIEETDEKKLAISRVESNMEIKDLQLDKMKKDLLILSEKERISSQDFERTCSELQTSYENKLVEIEKKNISRKNQVTELEGIISSLKSDNSHQKGLIQKLKERNEKLEKDLVLSKECGEHEVLKIKKNLDERQAKLDSIRENQVKLHKREIISKESIQQLEATCTQLRSSLHKMKADMTSENELLRTQIEEMKETITLLQSERSELEVQMNNTSNHLNQTIEESEANKKALKDLANDKNNAIEKMKKDLVSKGKTIEILNTELEALKEKANVSTQVNSDLESTCSQLRSSLHKMKADMTSENELLRTQIEEMKETITLLQSERSEHELSKAALTRSLGEKLFVIQQTLTESEAKAAAAIDLASDRKHAIENLKEDLEVKVTSLNQMNSESLVWKEKERALNNKIRDLETSYLELQSSFGANPLKGPVIEKNLSERALDNSASDSLKSSRSFVTSSNFPGNEAVSDPDQNVGANIEVNVPFLKKESLEDLLYVGSMHSIYEKESRNKNDDFDALARKSASRQILQMMDHKFCAITARAFRKWSCASSASLAVESHLNVVEEMTSQLETTSEKLAKLKSHLVIDSNFVSEEKNSDEKNDIFSSLERPPRAPALTKSPVIGHINNSFWDFSDSESDGSPHDNKK